MRLTKYTHSCFTVETEGKMLVVDPGGWTKDLGAPENVTAIVITHEHQDHFDVTAIGALIAHNPDAIVIAHRDITRQFGRQNETLPYHTVATGESIDIGPFKLEFFGGTHATIHPDIPVIANLGIIINDTIWYPGDSFALPERPVEILALPVAAPWLKASETMDYLAQVKPRLAFPTHDAILSLEGKALIDRMLAPVAERIGTDYQRLDGSAIDT